MKNLQERVEELIDNSQYDEASELVAKEIGFKLKHNDVRFDSMEWDKDGQKRYIVNCDLVRGKESYNFDFGTSVKDSCDEASEWDNLDESDLVEIYAGRATRNYNFIGSTKFNLMKSEFAHIEDTFINEKAKEVIDSFQEYVDKHNKKQSLKSNHVHFSINNTEAEKAVRDAIEKKQKQLQSNNVTSKNKALPQATMPSLYDVITAMTKYDPETFEDFCDNFGYDQDSRSAEKTYRAVKKEYNAMKRLFTEEELEILNYIQ